MGTSRCFTSSLVFTWVKSAGPGMEKLCLGWPETASLSCPGRLGTRRAGALWSGLWLSWGRAELPPGLSAGGAEERFVFSLVSF